MTSLAATLSTLSLEGAPGGGQLVIYNTSISDVTATIFPVPEVSTWAMMAFGLAGLGMAGRLREWRTAPRRTRNGVGASGVSLALG